MNNIFWTLVGFVVIALLVLFLWFTAVVSILPFVALMSLGMSFLVGQLARDILDDIREMRQLDKEYPRLLNGD